jgi:hypothetical protein
MQRRVAATPSETVFARGKLAGISEEIDAMKMETVTSDAIG